MTWELGLITAFFVFAALVGFTRVRRHALPPIQLPSDAAQTKALASTVQTMPVGEDTTSPFDLLRDAMQLDDTHLFVPLQVALADLIGLGRRLEVYTRCLMSYILDTYAFSQGQLGAKQELDALEARLRDFEIVAGVSATEAANANAAAGGDLQKLLRGGGE